MPTPKLTGGLIYHAFDTKTGRAYVGQTWMTLEQRMKEHLRGKRRGYFANALRARPNDFVWTIIAKVSTQQDLDAAEDSFILEFRTLKPDGFNIRRGGSCGRHSEETKQKISQTLAGTKASEAHRRAISTGLKGHVSWWKGKKLSLEHSGKISKSRMGYSHPQSLESRKKIAESMRRFRATNRRNP
jgi:group I intron endonuclease